MTTQQDAPKSTRQGALCVVVMAALAGLAGCDGAPETEPESERRSAAQVAAEVEAEAAEAEEAEIEEARERGKRAALEYIAEARARGELPPAPTEEREPEGPVPTAQSLSAEVEGDLDRDLIRRVVRAHLGEVRECYNKGLEHNPKLAGRISVQFTITGEGKASEAKMAESSLADAAVESCVIATVHRWIFPKPGDGAPVTVNYPFELSAS